MHCCSNALTYCSLLLSGLVVRLPPHGPSVVGQIYSAFLALKKYKLEFDTLALLKIYLISGLSCILPVILIQFLAFPNTLNVLFNGLLYLLIYTTIIPAFRILNLAEIKQASEVIQNVRFLSAVAKPVLKYQERIIKRVEPSLKAIKERP